jgi:predicted NAD/FAD-binding protein
VRIGVVGAGVAGMAAAWMLQDEHRVTLFDRLPRLGGHVETIAVEVGGATVNGELGPRFFFDSAYPYFLGLLRVLGVGVQWRDAKVSCTDHQRGHAIVLPPRTLRHFGLLARAPRLARHMLALRRLIEEQSAVTEARDYSTTFRGHLGARGYPDAFGPEFAYPFLAACWGAPLESIPEFPVYSLLKGMPHGARPGFYEIDGGMSRYVRALGEQLGRVDVRLRTGIEKIERRAGFRVRDERGSWHSFDRLILATPSFDAAALVEGVPTVAAMRAAVGAFRHFDVEIALHGDARFMPRRRADWAHHNLFFERDVAWMTDWQGAESGAPVFRTWMPKGRALPEPLHAHRTFRHVLMTPWNAVLQRRIASLQGEAGLFVTGMYAVDVDNHESALLSALVPVRALAPRAPNLQRLLAAVPADAPHDLGVLPLPLEHHERRRAG